MSQPPYLPPTYNSNAATITVSPTFPAPGDTITVVCVVQDSGMVGFSCSFANSCAVNGVPDTNNNPGDRQTWGSLPGNNPEILDDSPYGYQDSTPMPPAITYTVTFVLSELAAGIFDPVNNPLTGCWASVFSGNGVQGWISSAPFNVQPVVCFSGQNSST